MKRIIFIVSVVFLAISLHSCVEDPDVTPGVKGIGLPVFDGGATEMGKTATSMTVYAKIIKENGSKITERGFVYSTSPTPETDGTKVPYNTESGIGEFTMTIEGLTNGMEYYVIPYAMNEKGTEYGKPAIVINTNIGTGSVMTRQPYNILASAMMAGVKIINIGEAEIDSVGLYLLNKDQVVIRRVVDGPASIHDSIFSYKFEGLEPATQYYVKAFAKNKFGEFTGSLEMCETKTVVVSFGSFIIIPGFTDVKLETSVSNGDDETVEIVERGFWLSKTNPPSIDDSIRSGSGIGGFSEIITGLDAETQYFVRAYAINNFGATVFGRDTFFNTIKDLPTVMTGDVRDIANGKATVRGVLYDPGMSSIADVIAGICWSTTNNVPTTSDSVLYLSIGAGNEFAGQLTNLKGGTDYYVRAFARNQKGLAYGDDVVKFTTPSIFAGNLAPFPSAVRLSSTTAYFAVGDYLYILGGDLGAGCTDEMWAYSVLNNRWEPRLAFIGGPTKWQTAVPYGVGGAYVYGGNDGSGDEKAGIYFYDNNGNINKWYEPVANYDSITVDRAIGFSYNNNVFFVGGVSGDTVRKDVLSFDHATKTWRKFTDFPVGQYGGVAVLIDDIAYVGLGKDSVGVCNGSLWTTSDVGQTWSDTPIECTIYSGSILAGVAFDKSIYVIDEDYYILEYNTLTGLWSKKSRLPEANRGVHCMAVINRKIYIGLGQSANTLVVYDPIWDPSTN